MDSIKDKVCKILAEQFLVPVEELSDQIGPGDLPVWDSLGQMQMIMRLEKEFDLQFSVEDVMSINNVKDIIDLLGKHSLRKGGEVSASEHHEYKKVMTTALKLPGVTFWGEGSLTVLHKIGQKNIAIITGGSSYVEELKNKINACVADKAQINYFQRLSGEPKESEVLYLAKKLRDISPDLIIAIGGGSSIDIAKLSWALYEHPNLTLDDIVLPMTLPALRKKALFFAIPTTFGSGSEVSSAATFSKDSEGNKTIIVSHEFIPDQVILDPNLGKSMSLPLLFGSALDALTHAIEGYVSLVGNPSVDPYAIFSIRNIIKALHKIAEEGVGSESLRLLCYSAYYAGIVQNHCSVGAVHSIAHQLGTYNINHGTGNALFLTTVMKYNSQKTDKYKQMVDSCGFESLDDMIELIDKLCEKSQILPNLKTLKKVVEEKDHIIELTMKDITFKTNPVPLSKDDLNSMFNRFERGFLR